MHIRQVPTICCFCGCGCGLYLHVSENRVVGSTPVRSHPVSKGNLCVKGWHIHEFIHDSSRLNRPLIRKNGKLEEASWEEALHKTADAFKKALKLHGGRSIGVLSSAKCSNEENFLLQKLCRAVFSSNNIDHCARL